MREQLTGKERNTETGHNGNLQTQQIAISGLTNNDSYSYDGVNRISTFTEASTALQNYSYDAYRNRWIPSGTFLPYSTQTPQSNVFTNNQWAPGSGGNTYDAAGNQQSVSLGSGNYRSFTYDAESRQITASIPSMSAISYAYDGNGKRVQKSVGTTVTTYVYDAQGNLAAEYGGPGSSASGTTYLTADHLGSTRLLTNASGGPVERYDYAPFGEELTAGIDGRTTAMLFSTNTYPTVTPDSETIKFTGKERDEESGLDFFLARYYSSSQARFTSPDEFKGGGLFDPFTDKLDETIGPLPYADLTDPQTLNKYAYVRNNPLRYVDPEGHEEEAAEADTVVDVAIEEVDKVAKPLIESAVKGTEIGVGAVMVPLLILTTPGQASGNDEAKFERENQKQWQQQRSAGRVNPAVPSPEDAEHKKGARPGRSPKKDKHEERRPGTSPPPNYEPYREHERSKEEKKRDEEKKKQPYHRKDRDPKQQDS